MSAPPPPDDVQAWRLLNGFAENLVGLRRRSRRGQIEVAIRAGVHRTEVRLLERRMRMPGLDTVLKVAAGVDADPGELLDGLFWTLDPHRFQPPPRGRYSFDEREIEL
ncbi:MAG: helix-turn-helix transcriptional regulator [Solirubrobacterales bacterium]